MTQEEKAIAYDEAKYIMEEYLKSGNAGVIAENTIKKAFPELKDSEDEWIRKWLIEMVEEIRKLNPTNADHNGNCSEAIAWLDKQYADPIKEYWRGYNEGKQNVIDKYAELEKQGEQKPQRMVLAKAKEELYDKPAWSEEDESYLNTTIAYLKDAKEFKKTAENCIDWLKSLKNRVIPQPKQEWSEEDETARKDIIDKLKRIKMTYVGTECEICQLEIDWLKSLKDKVQPHPKQEWSEEDEQYLLVCKNALAKYQTTDKWDAGIISRWLEGKIKTIKDRVLPQSQQEWSEKDEKYIFNITHFLEHPTLLGKSNKHIVIEMVDWLKSLRPQNTWKPSEEQIEALKGVQEGVFRLGILESLYQDLKKLKG